MAASTKSSRVVWAVAMMAGALTAVRAQQTGAVVGGMIRTADPAAHPIRGAQMILSGAAISEGRVSVSDEDGHFLFRDLPAGRYTISASKPGLVSSWYGSRRPGRGPGTPVAVSAAQSVTNIAMTMAPGAVVAGRVLDHTGRPQRNATVSVIEVHSIGQAHPQVAAIGKTDDRGEYRVFGLPPGTYVVSIQPGFGFNSAVRSSSAELDALFRAPASAPASMPATVASSATWGYAPVVYPGTTDLSKGEAITLNAGDERTGLDITMQFVPAVKLHGTVVDPDGGVPRALEVGLVWPGLALGLSEMSYGGTLPAKATFTARDGVFSRDALTPGHYAILARAAEAGSGTPGPPVLWAIHEFDVTGAPLSDVKIQLQRGAAVSGRVVFDGATHPVADPTQIEVRLVPVAQAGITLAAPPVRVQQDGTFIVRGVPRGRFTVVAAIAGSPQATWQMQSATLRGVDVADAPIDVSPPGDVTDIAITFTDAPTVLAGAIVDALGRPAPEYVIVAFPVDRRLWTDRSWRVRSTRPATDGQFRFVGLPPGEYFVGALTDADSADLTDLSLLDALAAASTKAALAAHQTVKLDLRLGSR